MWLTTTPADFYVRTYEHPRSVPATTTETKSAATPSVETSNQPKVDQLEAHFSAKPAPKEPAKVAEPKAAEAPPPAADGKPAAPAVPTDDIDKMELGEKASDNARTNFAKLRVIDYTGQPDHTPYLYGIAYFSDTYHAAFDFDPRTRKITMRRKDGKGWTYNDRPSRARIEAIDSIAASVGDAQLVRDAKYGETPCTAEQLALKAMQKQAALGAKHLKDAKADNDESGAAGVGAAPNGGEEGSENDDKAKVDAIVGLYNSTKSQNGGKK